MALAYTRTYSRKYERMPLSVDLEVRDLATGQTCTGRSIDMSRGGIGFFAARFVAAGTVVCIGLRLHGPGGPAPLWVGAMIVRASCEGDGGVMGAEFDTPLNPATQPVLCQLLDGR